MTLTTLKSKVATYLNRAVSDLTLNGIDLVVHAANDLKLQAQKTVDFELLRQAVQVTVNLSTGGSLTSAIVYGGSAAVSVNRIKSAWIVQSGTTLTRPIEVVSRDTMQKRLGRNWDLSASWHDWARSSNDTLLTLPMDCPVLVREGNTIYLWPNDGNI
jgi:accessory colonization factor AcfC